MALLDNLISWWSLEEASGARADAHGTSTLTDVNTVGSAAGKVGQAASFVPANSEYLQGPGGACAIAGQSFSFAVWYKQTADAGYIALQGRAWRVRSAVGRIWFDVANTSAVFSGAYSASNSYTNGSWHLCIVTFDAGTKTLGISVDGGALESYAWTGTPSDIADPFYLGSLGTGTYFNGLLDEAAFWLGRVLTQAEIDWLYNSGAGRSYADAATQGGASYRAAVIADSPVAFYELDETSGTTLTDASGNGRNASHTGLVLAQAGATEGGTGVRLKGLEDGANSQITLPSGLQIPAHSPVSIEFWFKVASSDVGNTTLFNLGGSSATRLAAHVPWSDQNLYFDYGGTSGNSRISTSIASKVDSQWHHCVLQNGGGYRRIYLDGQKVAEQIGSYDLASALSGGNIGHPVELLDAWWKGYLDGFAVYTSVLPADRIAAHYAARVIAPSGAEPASVPVGYAATKAKGYSPAVTRASASVQVGYKSTTAKGYSPTLQVSARSVQAGFAASKSRGYTPSVSAGTPPSTIGVGFASSKAKGYSPGVTLAAAQVTVGYRSSSALGYAPSVQTGTPPGSVSVGYAVSSARGYSPEVSEASRTVQVGYAASKAKGYSASVSGSGSGLSVSYAVSSARGYSVIADQTPVSAEIGRAVSRARGYSPSLVIAARALSIGYRPSAARGYGVHVLDAKALVPDRLRGEAVPFYDIGLSAEPTYSVTLRADPFYRIDLSAKPQAD